MTLISLFTPTHDPKYLEEAYRSLQKQTYKGWQWVILPNGQCRDLPEAIKRDKRVRILPHSNCSSIGALKWMTCNACDGELLAELDHDDFLAPKALEFIAEAYHRNDKPGFLFSDDVKFYPDYRSEIYSTEFGWEHYNFEDNGHVYTIMKCFEADARSLCEVFWSPDHIRVWSRDAYQKTGGYDPTLRIADDHDLMCRTYIHGERFCHIQAPLYFYRRHDQNSFVKDNAMVQEQQTKNRDRYLHSLIFEWCKRKNLEMIDLGGAHDCPREFGFKALDLVGDVEYKMDVFDLESWPNESVGCFRSKDFFEHIHGSQIPRLMNLLYDKLVPGGWVISQTPSICDKDGKVGRGAFQDPTHQSFWSENNHFYWTRAEQSRYIPELRARFQAVRLFTTYPTKYHEECHIPYVIADLCAIKGQRLPGRKLI